MKRRQIEDNILTSHTTGTHEKHTFTPMTSTVWSFVVYIYLGIDAFVQSDLQ